VDHQGTKELQDRVELWAHQELEELWGRKESVDHQGTEERQGGVE
jgi:hypothetical protein